MLALNFGWNFRTITTVILLGVALIAYIGLKIRTKQLENDPEYQKQQKEKEEEYYRMLNEEKEMEDYISELSFGDDYSDEDYNENITE